jgi:epoxyqueuosine reductase
MNSAKDKYAQWIKEEAKLLGFDYCGIAKADFLEDEAPKLEAWLSQNYHGQMAYMANHFDKRLDPRLLVDGAQTVVSLMYNYYPASTMPEEGYQIAKYAYGEDYHQVIKQKLKTMLQNLTQKIGQFGGRVFVDSAPIMERQWAQKSGMGWLGKNSLLLNKNYGSFFFLAELIIDIEVTPDSPMIKDYCGTCTRCIDACPTDAIVKDGVVDGSKCISYYTIELKEQIPNDVKGKFNDWIFGCDICQDVCPWNRFSKPHGESKFNSKEELHQFTKKDWEEITEDVFEKLFSKSPIKRTKYSGLKRNINFVKQTGSKEENKS